MRGGWGFSLAIKQATGAPDVTDLVDPDPSFILMDVREKKIVAYAYVLRDNVSHGGVGSTEEKKPNSTIMEKKISISLKPQCGCAVSVALFGVGAKGDENSV